MEARRRVRRWDRSHGCATLLGRMGWWMKSYASQPQKHSPCLRVYTVRTPRAGYGAGMCGTVFIRDLRVEAVARETLCASPVVGQLSVGNGGTSTARLLINRSLASRDARFNTNHILGFTGRGVVVSSEALTGVKRLRDQRGESRQRQTRSVLANCPYWMSQATQKSDRYLPVRISVVPSYTPQL